MITIKSYELSFAKIIILREDIAEVIVNESVEIDVEMVEQFHHFLITRLTPPFSVIINKLNPYSYSFSAQQTLGSLHELRAIAIIVYSNISKLSAESMAAIPKKINWNIKIFTDRDEAIAWVIN